MNKTPYNEYILVMPSGNCYGFDEVEAAKAYINRYYEKKIDEGIRHNDYNDATEKGAQPRANICGELGVNEGVCKVYRLIDFIEKIEEDLVFDSEKEEVISKLQEEEIHLNIYDYRLDAILAETEALDVMEQYGDKA